MSLTYTYQPFLFFLITLIGTWILEFITAYKSYQKDKQKYALFVFVGLCVPFLTALIMIYGSGNQGLVNDFKERLLFFKIHLSSLIWILLLMPAVVFLATCISLLFGQATDQFLVADENNVLKGNRIFSLLVPFVLAPILEELGWRGYGVDSLRAQFNLFTTSMLFGFFWAIWHLPLFFIKGYYHHQLWKQSIVYVINFFISILPIAILANWIYYTNHRSIFAAVLFHSVCNVFSIVFKTTQFTKCIVTIILCLISIVLILVNWNAFF